VKGNVPVAEATRDEAVLPERVQETLGQLVGAAKEGLLALSVGVGLGVLTELMEEEVDNVVGPKGKWDAERTAVRHGHEAGEVTLGGRRVEVQRPRVRTADGESEVGLATYEHFADRDPLGRVVLERMLAGVSTRRYRRTQEPVGEDVETTARSTSKSAVSRTFVERTREALGELMSRQLGDLRLAVMMLDGLELKGRMMIVALGITTEGVKIPLGLWEGSTENATVATALLSDLVERGLDPEQGMLVGDRRLQGAAQGRAIGVRRGPRAALSVAQRAQRHAPSPRARPRHACARRGGRPTISVRSSNSPGSRTSSSTPTPEPPARSGRGWTRR
jgi:putative transposase